MCGIGVVLSRKADRGGVAEALKGIESLQKHRGPDHQGIFIEDVGNNGTLGFCHQRLSILDLSPAGHQPMISACGRYVLVYNGEVYNYLDIASTMRDDPNVARSPGDTAVVMASLIRWGSKALALFNGMWALAFYDRLERSLLISRDRFGIKPLYIYNGSDKVIIASEVKSIAGTCRQKLHLNRESVVRYLLQSITNGDDQTFFDEVRAVPAASFAEIDVQSPRPPSYRRYWYHPHEISSDNGAASPSEFDLRETLIDAVCKRLRSDVPVALLLSGGLDSSAILAAWASAQRVDNITALSVVSEDPRWNEERFIDIMLNRISCKSVKINVESDPGRLLEQLPTVCWYSDQPLGGLSAVAHYEMMAFAKARGVTVLLSGQGADEQLGGYNKYFYFYIYHCLRSGLIREAASMVMGCLIRRTILNEFTWSEARRYLLPKAGLDHTNYIGERFASSTLYRTGPGSSYEEREFQDIRNFSVPMLVHYEDRMSMAHAREIRLPFLDFRLVELLARVPKTEKFKNGWTKHIARLAYDDMLPKEITWRRDKNGFGLPEERWARTTLRPSFEGLFQSEMMSIDYGIIRPNAPGNLYARFLDHDPLVSYKQIFNIFCLEQWLRCFQSYISP